MNKKDIDGWKMNFDRLENKIDGWKNDLTKWRKKSDKFGEKMSQNIFETSWLMCDVLYVIEKNEELKVRYYELQENLIDAKDCLEEMGLKKINFENE